jgi:2-dehydro-3-deoxygluconokinase
MNTRSFDLLGLGECMVELLADGPLGQAGSLRRGFGGDVLNALVAAARLGARCGFMTRVGDDPFGPGLLAAWRGEGIDTACAPLVAGENGVYFVSLDDGGEREFSYRRRGTAASALAAGHLDEDYVAGARCLLLSGITQALSASARQATLEAAVCAHRHGVLVAFDPNYRPRLWAEHGGVLAAREALQELLPHVDLLLPSFPADAILLPVPASDAVRSARGFAAMCRLAAQKCGAGGCLLTVDGRVSRVPAQAGVTVVDSTGAGDAWNGAFLFYFLRGVPPELAARQANAVAAATLAHRGAIPPLEKDHHAS